MSLKTSALNVSMPFNYGIEEVNNKQFWNEFNYIHLIEAIFV